MATLSIVITYTGTPGLDEEVQSFTSGGVAYAALTDTQVLAALGLMKKAQKRAIAERASSLRRGNR